VVISRVDRRGAPQTTVLCEGCGLARSHPLPSREELLRFYRDEYRLRYKGTWAPRTHHVLRAGRLALERIGRLRDLLAAGMNVLDVGCGGGEFLYFMRASGCRAIGIEPNTAYASYAGRELGLDMRAGFADDHDFPAQHFDAITAFHVLEHVSTPVDYLSRLAGWLRPGGFLAVEAPNLEFTGQHPAHRFHVAHLFHFNMPTLLRAGELAGLAAIRAETTPDGGNLFAVFRPEVSVGRELAPIPGNFERLWRLEQERSARLYWVSPATWGHAARRLCRMAEERRTARRFGSRRAILDWLAERLETSG
jgi:2-polyprenyl-3-methyl-5-hydroxy-6-metoxy-1,4-benzoquinol methylase